jgi:plasmid stabilization system protein ParE
MKRHIAFRPEALLEVEEAIDWYESRGKGLGTEFLRAFEAALARIHRNSELYPIVRGLARRAPIRRFPYNVVYSLDGEQLLIIACFHTSRDPKRWQERLPTD